MKDPSTPNGASGCVGNDTRDDCQLKRQKVKFTALAPGDPSILVGTCLRAKGRGQVSRVLIWTK